MTLNSQSRCGVVPLVVVAGETVVVLSESEVELSKVVVLMLLLNVGGVVVELVELGDLRMVLASEALGFSVPCVGDT